ncbi:unnamed protein product [Closterium sp. NIES-65]|nr:unnamed protein product [Closterium sp. NIES-65]
MFSWPSQEDATAFRRLFPFTLKLPNSRPVLLKEFVDRFVAKAVGEPTLSIRNGLLEYAPEDIHVFLLDSTKPDGAHWLADLTNFHRAPDPYEGTYFTHLAGLPVATFDDPHSELIPSEILLKANKPPMLLNFSYHVCSFFSNNHRASDHDVGLDPGHPHTQPASALSPRPPLSPPILCLLSPFTMPSPLPSPSSLYHFFTWPPLPSALHSPTRSLHTSSPSLLSPTHAGNPPSQSTPLLPPFN